MERESPAESVSRRAFPMPNITWSDLATRSREVAEAATTAAVRRERKKNSRVRATGKDSLWTHVKQAGGERVTSAEPLRKCLLVTPRTSRATVPCLELRPPLFPFRLLITNIQPAGDAFDRASTSPGTRSQAAAAYPSSLIRVEK